MKTTLAIALFVLLISVATSPSAATFKGKVVDADTKEPLDGAVVVAVWIEERTTPTATHSRLRDVKEVLTDKNGDWAIIGPKGGQVGKIKAIISVLTGIYFTLPPTFIVFKPGYCSWPAGFAVNTCKERMDPSDVRRADTIELPRLKKRDRMTIIQNTPSLGIAGEAEDTLHLFKTLVEREYKEIRK